MFISKDIWISLLQENLAKEALASNAFMASWKIIKKYNVLIVHCGYE